MRSKLSDCNNEVVGLMLGGHRAGSTVLFWYMRVKEEISMLKWKLEIEGRQILEI